MPSYKLTYFDLKGIGESLRMLLSYGEGTFEDVRVKFEDWPALKPKTPFGVMPLLEFDGKVMHQSIAIARYLGKKYNLAGKNDLEDLEIDAIVDTFNDFRIKLSTAFWEADETIKAKKLKVAVEETLPFYLGKLNDIAKANNGHMALKRLTWADFIVAGALEYLVYTSKVDIPAKYPGLKAVADNVNALPKVKAWIAKRPVTDL